MSTQAALPTPSRDLPRPPGRVLPGLTLGLAAAQVGAIVWQFSFSGGGADLSQRGDDPPVVPALYTFAIWGPIYVSSLAYAVYGLLPGQRGRELHRRVGPYAAAAFGASTLWALAAGFPPPWVTWGTVAMIFAMFGSLLVALLRASRLARTRADHLLTVSPLALYAGYVTLATVANTAASLKASGVNTPLGLGVTPWAVLMLAAAGGLASFVARRTGGPLAYGAAAIWGLIGVAVQNAVVEPNPPVGVAAGLAALAVAGTTWWARRRTRGGAFTS
ncbi:hypothetical protein [Deinococcus apachensis]|uniref:hypothetical protein n=1 Tax=Deinococcus apachensis TaxID=309886 RepID=UPI00036BF9C8|nr:hypothetical protein [Deinococcus apachensis]